MQPLTVTNWLRTLQHEACHVYGCYLDKCKQWCGAQLCNPQWHLHLACMVSASLSWLRSAGRAVRCLPWAGKRCKQTLRNPPSASDAHELLAVNGSCNCQLSACSKHRIMAWQGCCLSLAGQSFYLLVLPTSEATQGGCELGRISTAQHQVFEHTERGTLQACIGAAAVRYCSKDEFVAGAPQLASNSGAGLCTGRDTGTARSDLQGPPWAAQKLEGLPEASTGTAEPRRSSERRLPIVCRDVCNTCRDLHTCDTCRA